MVIIACLLALEEENISQFTQEKIEIYQAGHIPWGYEGDFPQGIGIVI